MLFINDDRPDNAPGEIGVIAIQLRKQVFHGAAGAGATSKQENLLSVVQRFCDGLVKAFLFRLALAVRFVLDVMQVPARTVRIVGNDGLWHGAVKFRLVDASHAVVDDDKHVNPVMGRRMRW